MIVLKQHYDVVGSDKPYAETPPHFSDDKRCIEYYKISERAPGCFFSPSLTDRGLLLSLQAPANMKSVLQGGWLLTVAFGNVIVLIVAEGAGLEQVLHQGTSLTKCLCT